MAPKSHLKSSKTSKKEIPKITLFEPSLDQFWANLDTMFGISAEPILGQFCSNFWSHFCAKTNPKARPKTGPIFGFPGEPRGDGPDLVQGQGLSSNLLYLATLNDSLTVR